MNVNARIIIAVSVVLSILTFSVGYFVYEQMNMGSGFIQIEPVREEITITNHSATIGAVNSSEKISFFMQGPPNATAWVELEPGGQKLMLEQAALGRYHGIHLISEFNESTIISTTFVANYKGVEMREAGPHIDLDLSPPEITVVRAMSVAYGDGDTLILMIEAEPDTSISAAIDSLQGFMPAEEISKGMYSLAYSIRNGDDRNTLTIRAMAEDSLGNIVEHTFFLPTVIVTSGPQLLRMSASPELVGFGKTIKFTLEGAPGATGHLDIGLASGLPLAEIAPGVYTAQYTLDQKNLYGTNSIIATLVKGETSTRGMGQFTFDSVAPLIKSFSVDKHGAIKGNETITIVMHAEPNGSAFYQVAGFIPLTKMNASTPMNETGNGYYTAVYSPEDDAVGMRIAGLFVDEAGNAGNQLLADEMITVDTITPNITDVVFEAPGLINSTTTISVGFKAEEGGEAFLSLGGKEYEVSETGFGWYQSTIQLGECNSSAYAVPTIKFTDAAGNVAEQYPLSPLTIDNDNPEIITMYYTANDILMVGAYLNVTMITESGGKAWFILRDINTNKTLGPIYLYESQPGEYLATYSVKETDAIRSAVVIGHFEDAAGNEAEPFLIEPQKSSTPFQFNLLIGLAAVVLIIPSFLFYYTQHMEKARYEESFPDFLSELHSIMGSQLPLPQALRIISNSDFGKLSALVRKMNNRITMGVPFHEAFITLGKETKSKSIASAISVLVSGYKAGGGRIAKMFEATANNFRQLRSMKQDRKSELQVHVITGYIIFFVFLLVLVLLNNSLFSANPEAGISMFGANESVAVEGVEDIVSRLQNIGDTGASQSKFTDLLFYLFFIQAFFSGISIGELTEGSFIGGLKHSVAMMLIALIATAFLV